MIKKLKFRFPLSYKRKVDFRFYYCFDGFKKRVLSFRRKKWFSVQGQFFQKSTRSWFLASFPEPLDFGRKKIKLSWCRRAILLRSVKFLFELFSANKLKTKLKFICQKTNRQKNLVFLNLLERRLVSILFRSRFFSRLSLSAAAIRAGDVYVNNRCVTSIHFIVTPQDIIDIRGVSRKMVRYNLYLLRKSLSLNTRLNLFPNQRIRRFCHPYSNANREERLTLALQRAVNRVHLFLLKETRRKGIKKGNRKSSSIRKSFFLWPLALSSPAVPSYLVVSAKALTIYLKHTVCPKTLSLFYQQNFCFSELWRV